MRLETRVLPADRGATRNMSLKPFGRLLEAVLADCHAAELEEQRLAEQMDGGRAGESQPRTTERHGSAGAGVAGRR